MGWGDKNFDSWISGYSSSTDVQISLEKELKANYRVLEWMI